MEVVCLFEMTQHLLFKTLVCLVSVFFIVLTIKINITYKKQRIYNPFKGLLKKRKHLIPYFSESSRAIKKSPLGSFLVNMHKGTVFFGKKCFAIGVQSDKKSS